MNINTPKQKTFRCRQTGRKDNDGVVIHRSEDTKFVTKLGIVAKLVKRFENRGEDHVPIQGRLCAPILAPKVSVIETAEAPIGFA